MSRRLEELGWLPIFACFLTLRLFSALEVFPVINDAPKYLALAESFPAHTLYNQQTYLIHSPVVGYAIGLIALVLPTLTAALLVSVLAGAANFFLTRRLAGDLGLNAAGQAGALLVVSVTELSVWVDSQVGRMGLLLTFCLATLCAFLRYVERGEGTVPRWTTLWLCLALATSEQALALFPAMAIVLWFRRRPPVAWAPVLASWLIGAVVFLLWPAFRLWTYLRHADYPAGIDGTVEDLTRFSVAAVFQPNVLPLTDGFRSFYTTTSFSPANFDPSSLHVFADWVLVPRAAAAVACILLPAAGLLLGTPRQRAAGLMSALLTLLFFAPPLFGMYPRYGLGYVYFFAVLVGSGLDRLSRRVPRGEPALTGFAAAAALIVSAAWLLREPELRVFSPVAVATGGRHFLFAREPVVAGESLARHLEALPGDGIMAPIGMVPSLALQLDKRVLALPVHPDRLEPLLERYRIEYLVVTSDLFVPSPREEFDLPTGRLTAAEIAGEPARFELVGTFEEERPFYFRKKEYVVFGVRR